MKTLLCLCFAVVILFGAMFASFSLHVLTRKNIEVALRGLTKSKNNSALISAPNTTFSKPLPQNTLSPSVEEQDEKVSATPASKSKDQKIYNSQLEVGVEKNKTQIEYGYRDISDLLSTSNASLCKKFHVLKGENAREPDVHVCLDRIRPPCVVYSFGIAYNWIFDDFMITKGCDVFSFDPSMTLGKHKRHKNHLFEPLGIGPISGVHRGKSTLYGGKTNYNVLSLEDMMDRYGHTHIDLIRMDVESAEWDVLQAWTKNNLWQRFNQLLLEIHMYGNEHEHADALLKVPFSLFHVARNRHNMHKLYKDMTAVYEVGFIKDKNDHQSVLP